MITEPSHTIAETTEEPEPLPVKITNPQAEQPDLFQVLENTSDTCPEVTKEQIEEFLNKEEEEYQ